jgi:hypothetical protein
MMEDMSAQQTCYNRIQTLEMQTIVDWKLDECLEWNNLALKIYLRKLSPCGIEHSGQGFGKDLQWKSVKIFCLDGARMESIQAHLCLCAFICKEQTMHKNA